VTGVAVFAAVGAIALIDRVLLRYLVIGDSCWARTTCRPTLPT
jgi:hypothetical protein